MRDASSSPMGKKVAAKSEFTAGGGGPRSCASLRLSSRGTLLAKPYAAKVPEIDGLSLRITSTEPPLRFPGTSGRKCRNRRHIPGYPFASRISAIKSEIQMPWKSLVFYSYLSFPSRIHTRALTGSRSHRLRGARPIFAMSAA